MTRSKFYTMALTASLLTALSTPGFAQETHSSSEIPSGNYAVDPNHTQISFTVLHMGFSNYTGRLNGVAGTLTLSAKDPAASALSVSVPTASFSTTSEKLDGELKSPQWFDADKFPTVTFKSTKITLTGKDSATVAGDLTLHGVTKPVTLTAHLVGFGSNPFTKKYTVGFDVNGTIKRSDFGVITYAQLIGDDVRLTINGAFERQD